MNAPQIIRAPAGELVVLPRADYEALIERADQEAEAADDVAIYHARKAELAVDDVVAPPEVSAAMLRGDSRLRAIRRWRDRTQVYLEAETGIVQGYLSDLELDGGRGRRRRWRSWRGLWTCRWIGFCRPSSSRDGKHRSCGLIRGEGVRPHFFIHLFEFSG